MNATLPPVFVFRAFDADGIPLAGGKLYSFAATTTTPLATYSDQGMTPNTNPVILDANGQASLWLGDSSYKFDLYDVNDVQQPNYPVDNVREASASLAADLQSVSSASLGAGMIGYNAALNYASGTIGYLNKFHSITSASLASDNAALVVNKTPVDANNPNIVALFQNTSEATGYDGEVHIRLQAGTNTSHRAYINFSSWDTDLSAQRDKWVTGRNAESCWILYNSETIHRLWMDPGADGPDPSFRTGNTYLNSAENGKIRINWHPSDKTGLGGLEVWSGGNNGSGVTNNSLLASVATLAEPLTVTASCAGSILTVTATSGVITGNKTVIGSGYAYGTYITSQISGTAGGAGTYQLNVTPGTVASQVLPLGDGVNMTLFGVQNGGVGAGALIVYGGAYFQRAIRTDDTLQVGAGVGFNGVSPLAKPTIVGSRGANTAVANILTALANYGLIVDSTTI